MVRHGIDLNSEAITEFCRRWRITGLWVFGSFLRDDFRPESDIDFLVEHEEDAIWDLSDLEEMRKELGAILGREVDVADHKAIANSRNRFIRRAIMSTAEPVYARG